MYDITVIVPVYNTEAFLGLCLDSLVRQTHKNIEIIVVNDASPGNCKEIVHNYGKRYSNIRYLEHDQNMNLLQARLTGMAQAQGRYIMHVDSDDRISHDTCKELVKAIEKSQAEVIQFPAYQIWSNGRITPRPIQPILSYLHGKEAFKKFLSIDIHCCVWGKIFKKSLSDYALDILQPRQFRLIYAEDLVFSLVQLYKAERYYGISTGKYYYCHNDLSMTRKKHNTWDLEWKCRQLADSMGFCIEFLSGKMESREKALEALTPTMSRLFSFLYGPINSLRSVSVDYLYTMLFDLFGWNHVLRYLGEKDFSTVFFALKGKPGKKKKGNLKKISIISDDQAMSQVLSRTLDGLSKEISLLKEKEGNALSEKCVKLPKDIDKRWSLIQEHCAKDDTDICIIVDNGQHCIPYDILSLYETSTRCLVVNTNLFSRGMFSADVSGFEKRQMAYRLCDAVVCLNDAEKVWCMANGVENICVIPLPFKDPQGADCYAAGDTSFCEENWKELFGWISEGTVSKWLGNTRPPQEELKDLLRLHV